MTPKRADEKLKTPLNKSNVEGGVILKKIIESKPHLQKFRSGGFVNKDYDMARIYIDLPINEAGQLMDEMNKIVI